MHCASATNMRPLRGTQSMNPHCFSPGFFAFFSLLKALYTHYPPDLYPRIFGRTLTTYIPVAVLHEEHPTLPVSLALLPLFLHCVVVVYLSLHYTCVYVIRGCARAYSRLSSILHVYIRMYTSRRKSLSVPLFIFFFTFFLSPSSYLRTVVQ